MTQWIYTTNNFFKIFLSPGASVRIRTLNLRIMYLVFYHCATGVHQGTTCTIKLFTAVFYGFSY
jgi:hypothetical protein